MGQSNHDGLFSEFILIICKRSCLRTCTWCPIFCVFFRLVIITHLWFHFKICNNIFAGPSQSGLIGGIVTAVVVLIIIVIIIVRLYLRERRKAGPVKSMFTLLLNWYYHLSAAQCFNGYALCHHSAWMQPLWLICQGCI